MKYHNRVFGNNLSTASLPCSAHVDVRRHLKWSMGSCQHLRFKVWKLRQEVYIACKYPKRYLHWKASLWNYQRQTWRGAMNKREGFFFLYFFILNTWMHIGKYITAEENNLTAMSTFWHVDKHNVSNHYSRAILKDGYWGNKIFWLWI